MTLVSFSGPFWAFNPHPTCVYAYYIHLRSVVPPILWQGHICRAKHTWQQCQTALHGCKGLAQSYWSCFSKWILTDHIPNPANIHTHVAARLIYIFRFFLRKDACGLSFDFWHQSPSFSFDTCVPVPQTPQKIPSIFLKKKTKRRPLRRQHRVRQAAERNIFRSSVTKKYCLWLYMHNRLPQLQLIPPFLKTDPRNRYNFCGILCTELILIIYGILSIWIW